MESKLTINQQTVINNTLSFFRVLKTSGDFTNQELVAKTYGMLIRTCKAYGIRTEAQREQVRNIVLSEIKLTFPAIKHEPCWKCGTRKALRNPNNWKWECFECYFNIKTDQSGEQYMELKVVDEAKRELN